MLYMYILNFVVNVNKKYNLIHELFPSLLAYNSIERVEEWAFNGSEIGTL